jgi:hypothetical protein
MRAGFLTGTHRHRSSDEGHSLLGRRECAYHERNTSANHCQSFEAIFWASTLCNSNTSN